jgi:tripartite-type tricarboxylate transporter receptor subunit TctC
VAELTAFAKANPASSTTPRRGNGTTSYLTAEPFKSMAGGGQIIHIPCQGTAPALADLLGGQVDMMCDNLGGSLREGAVINSAGVKLDYDNGPT